jgi:hypothetical protein
MKVIIQDTNIYKNIDHQEVAAYLKSHGWHFQQQMNDKASIWTLGDTENEDFFEILLPLRPNILDFARRMGEVIETLALAENRSQIDVLSEFITNYPNLKVIGVVMQMKTPNADKFSGEIIIFGIILDKLRKINIELADHDYLLAIKAYQERLAVACTGDLIKEDNIFILKNPRYFQIENI